MSDYILHILYLIVVLITFLFLIELIHTHIKYIECKHLQFTIEYIYMCVYICGMATWIKTLNISLTSESSLLLLFSPYPPHSMEVQLFGL